MTLNQIETRARNLLAASDPEGERLDLLGSFLETLENLTDRQSKDVRILRQMESFLARLEAGLSAK